MGVFDLPDPSSTTLAKAPLEQVIWQVRHESKPWEVEAVLQVRDQLQAKYPIIEQASVAEFALTIGAPPAASNDSRSGWRLRTSDSAWTLVLMPDFFAVECTGYTRWTDFRTRSEELAEAVAARFKPALLQRVGLRYVDRLVRPGTGRPGQWRGLAEDIVLGFAGEDLVSSDVQTVQTLNQFETGMLSATLRTSCATDSVASGYSLLIDTDCYDARARTFELTDVLRTTSDLHTLNLKLFQRCISSTYLEELTRGG